MSEFQHLPEDEIFASAVEIDDVAARTEFLDQACRGNPNLRRSIDELLALHHNGEEFLDTPILRAAQGVGRFQSGAMVGPYRLVEQIGEGGFGVVWKAEQTSPIQRDVALKIMKRRSKVALQPKSERQSLAMMDHANIARALDAGTTDCGRAYFVMELVRGDSILKHCDQNRRGIAARLSLFRDVCLAVHHAHQRGIIHRDIKPGNILVATIDGDDVPKVIDFGIATMMRSLDQPSDNNSNNNEIDSKTSDRSATDTKSNGGHTQPIVGTPEFMSPEQLIDGLEVATRADVYGLGGVLYRLLVGASPRPKHNQGLSRKELAEALLQSELHLLRREHATDLGAISKLRSTTKLDLRKQLRGDLEWITQKALAPDKSHRYESALELAKDIKRHLSNQPVSAAPSSTVYLIRKFTRRNRSFTYAALMAIAAMVLGTAFAMRGYLKAEVSRQLAEESRQQADRERAEAVHQKRLAVSEAIKAKQVSSLLIDLLWSTDPEQGFPVDFTVRQQLDQFAAALDSDHRLTDSADVRAALLRAIGRSYLTLRDLQKAEPRLREAMEIRTRLFSEEHALPLESRVDYCNYLIFANRHRDAAEELDSVLKVLTRQDAVALTVQALNLRAGAAAAQLDLESAIEFGKQAWDTAIAVHGKHDVITLLQEARFAQYVIRSSRDLVDLQYAEWLAREAYEETLRQVSDRESAFDVSMAKWQFGGSLVYLRYFEEAKSVMQDCLNLHREHLGEKSSFVARDLVRLSVIQRNLGDIAKARQLALQAVDIGENSVYDRNVILHRAYNVLLQVVERDSLEEADTLGKQIEIIKVLKGDPARGRLAKMLRKRAWVLERLGQRESAIACLSEAISFAVDFGQTRAATRMRAERDELLTARPQSN